MQTKRRMLAFSRRHTPIITFLRPAQFHNRDTTIFAFWKNVMSIPDVNPAKLRGHLVLQRQHFAPDHGAFWYYVLVVTWS